MYISISTFVISLISGEYKGEVGNVKYFMFKWKIDIACNKKLLIFKFYQTEVIPSPLLLYKDFCLSRFINLKFPSLLNI